MADSVNILIEKAKLLESKYRGLRNENTLLRADLERKQSELEEAHGELVLLRKNYALLSTARALGANPSKRAEAQKQIAEVVRKIDKFLVFFNE
jgi:predicted nuclease with TOPRIM domain